MQLQRTLLPTVNAVIITLALFALMQSLIGKQEAQISFPQPLGKLEFAPREPDDIVITTMPKPQKPELLSDPPDRIKPIIEQADLDDGHVWGEPNFDPPTFDLDGPSDGQQVLVLGFPPIYPAKAIARGIEGYAVVGFTVAPSGAVIDEYIIESAPAGIFDKASLKAITRFKYQPKQVGGKAVAAPNQRYMFTYQLDKD